VKRILMVLTVALVMVAIVVVTVTPAFAQGRGSGPQTSGPLTQECRTFVQEEFVASPQQASFFCTPSRGFPSL